MPHSTPLAAHGVRQRAARAGATVRRRQDSPADRLARLSGRLDELLRDVSIGAQSQRQHELHVEEAEAIARELRATFRSPTRPENAPIWHQGGKAAW